MKTTMVEVNGGSVEVEASLPTVSRSKPMCFLYVGVTLFQIVLLFIMRMIGYFYTSEKLFFNEATNKAPHYQEFVYFVFSLVLGFSYFHPSMHLLLLHKLFVTSTLFVFVARQTTLLALYARDLQLGTNTWRISAVGVAFQGAIVLSAIFLAVVSIMVIIKFMKEEPQAPAVKKEWKTAIIILALTGLCGFIDLLPSLIRYGILVIENKACGVFLAGNSSTGGVVIFYSDGIFDNSPYWFTIIFGLVCGCGKIVPHIIPRSVASGVIICALSVLFLAQITTITSTALSPGGCVIDYGFEIALRALLILLISATAGISLKWLW